MSGIVVFLTTLFLILLIFFGLAVLRRPFYRLTKENVICLIELVLSGEATEEDWTVFIEMPIRYDSDLESVRERCALLSEADKTGLWNSAMRTDDGQAELQAILIELKAQS